MVRLKKLVSEVHRRSIWQVLGVYLIAGWGALQAVQSLTDLLALPEWFPAFAVVLLIVGLPVVLATAFVQEGVVGGGGREEPPPGAGAGSADAQAGPAGPGAAYDRENPGTALRLFTWRNAIAGGVLAFALWGVVATAYLFWLRPTNLIGAVARGAEVVAVLPFNVTGDVGLTGEGMVDLLSSNLDQVGPIRTVAPQTVLAQWEQAARDGRPDLQEAMAVGRAAEAGSILTGSIVAAGAEARVDATLHTVTGDVLARAQVSGSADDLLGLVDVLSVNLLREIWRSEAPVPNMRVSAISTGNVGAIRAYLEGVSAYRQSRHAEAAEALNRAVEADSTFALAHLTLGEVYGWTNAFPSNRVERLRRRELHLREALRFTERLPERETAFAIVSNIRLDGDRDAYRDSLRALVQRYPDEPRGWYRLGDFYFHEFEGLFVSPAEAMEPFLRVVALDPTARPQASHLVDLLMSHLDREAFQRYASAVADAEPEQAEALANLERAIWDTPDVDQAVRVLTRLPQGFSVAAVSYALAFGPGRRPADVANGLDALASELAPRAPIANELAKARRRVRQALGQLDRAREITREIEESPWDRYQVLTHPAVAGIAGARWLEESGPTEPAAAEVPSLHGDHWLGLVRLAEGDDEGAVDRLNRGLAGASELERTEYEALYGAARGLVMLARGDSTAAVVALEAAGETSDPASGRALPSTTLTSLQYDPGHLALAVAWTNDPATRIKGLQILRKPFVLAPEFELPAAYWEGRALELDGDADGAREAYAWFVDTASGADAGLPLLDLVAEARAALDGLR